MLTETLANLCNRGLPRSVRARQLCRELAGRSLVLEVRGVVQLHIASTGETLTMTRGAQPADARLSVGPLGVLALAGEGDGVAALLKRGAAEISGDAEIAGKFRELLRLLRPDPEEELALILGDVPAHQLGRAARGVAAWSRRAVDTTWRNTADYLGHERRHLIPRREAEQFLRGVDTLREDVDRVSARLELLAQRRAPRAGGPRTP